MVSYINEWIVREYSELVKDQDGVVLLGVESLTVEEAQTLRNDVRETGAQLVLGKKRLVRVALREVGIELEEGAWSEGSTVLLVGDTESAISAAKTIEKIYKGAEGDDRKVTYRGAYFDGTVMNAKEAASIAGMPDRQTLRAMMAGVLSAPARKLATVLNEVGASTTRCVQARVDQGDAA
ncbi:MAG: 50S ribosomal protein L10 [Planctomycetes bacterium]|nr:50S ribosomal protein L10 [Planctomycetota bacterium]